MTRAGHRRASARWGWPGTPLRDGLPLDGPF